jgi:hypothetical protein
VGTKIRERSDTCLNPHTLRCPLNKGLIRIYKEIGSQKNLKLFGLVCAISWSRQVSLLQIHDRRVVKTFFIGFSCGLVSAPETSWSSQVSVQSLVPRRCRPFSYDT